MRANAGIFIIICLLFLVGTVGAAGPFTITITSSKTYLIAGYTDNQAVISVNIKNSSTSAPVSGADVKFSVDDASFGTFGDSGVLSTNSLGDVTNTFTSKTKSGLATITVKVNETQTQSFVQKIDHDKPSKVLFIPPYEGTVGTVVAFNTSFTDYWGNPIDNMINPSEVHAVNLHVHGPSPDDCLFVGYGHDLIATPLDANGTVPVMIKLTTVIGSNYVSMEAFDLSPPPKVISAISGVPVSIEQVWSPSGSPPQLPAGASFDFIYVLYDKFKNPVKNQFVWINSTSGQNLLSKTLDDGNIQGKYSEPITGDYTVTAVAESNTTVTLSQTVRFYNATPKSHNVVVNPQTMPSRDVKADIYSNISAKVVDEGGNGVPGETVTFTLSDITFNPSTAGSTAQPSFSSSDTVKTVSADTDSEGIATVKFYPGAFNTTGVNYSQTATGNAKITATWNSIPKVADVAWKNYAYLSAVLSVKPAQVTVGDTVDVNLKLNGDGWSLTRKPIDVVLIIDRSGSMADGSPTKISSAKAAAKTFIGSMAASTNNRVGLVSFASSTTKDKSLTNDFDAVNYSIDHLSADGATQMRQALYQAITDIDKNGRSDAVKAVILLTDGDWNYDGSPLAVGNGFPSSTYGLEWPGNVPNFDSYEYYSDLGGGTSHTAYVNVPDGSYWDGSKYVADYTSRNTLHYDAVFTSQNMSVYASENQVRLYALSFVNQPSSSVQSALTIMTTGTEKGFYQHAPDVTSLNGLYTQIAGQLLEDAGVDTTADMDFSYLIVDDNLIDTTAAGNAMFDYVGDPPTPGTHSGSSYTQAPGSTMVDKYNATTKLIPGPDFTTTGPLIVNQTSDWVADKALHFNIGLVKLGDTWETNFRFRALNAGTILLFSPGSTINFKDTKGVESSLTLKNLSYLTVVNDPSEITVSTIGVTLTCPYQADTTVPDIPVSWTRAYTGGETDIFEEARYRSESGALVPFFLKSYHVTGDSTETHSANFDLSRVAPGNYQIFVHVYTPGSVSATSSQCGPYSYNTEGKTFIKLK
jgi:hypothetical protein